jgi:hypothetical protein
MSNKSFKTLTTGVGRASSRQSDRQSDGGYRSDGMMGGRGSAGSGSGVCGSRTGIDGYRSEGSTDSPMRHNQTATAGNGSIRKPHHRQMQPMQPMPNSQNFLPQPPGSGKPPPLPPHHGPAHLKQRNGQLELVSQPAISQQQQQQQQQLQQCSTSRSMHSFQRQESSASFQSGVHAIKLFYSSSLTL